jgi:hypothetical protein
VLNAGGQDGFQVGQTAKARLGHRVQSLLKEDEPPVVSAFRENTSSIRSGTIGEFPSTHIPEAVGNTARNGRGRKCPRLERRPSVAKATVDFCTYGAA